MRKKKYAMTLIEIMVVVVLIGIITSALAYNLKGAMQKAKIFKTKEGQKRITHILSMQLLEGRDAEELEGNWQYYIENDPLIKKNKSKDYLKDGWGKFYDVRVYEDGDIRVLSKSLQAKDQDEYEETL